MPKPMLIADTRVWVIGALCLVSMLLGISCIALMNNWHVWPALGVILLLTFLAVWAMRPRVGNVRVRLAAVALCATIVALLGANSLGSHLLVQGLNFVLSSFFPTFPLIPEPQQDQWPLIVFGIGVVFIVFHYTRQSVLAPSSSPDPHSSLRLPEYRQRFRWAVESLATHLKDLNRKLDWSDGRFVELEAELEENSDAGSRRRVRHLVDALRHVRGREIVLLLGEPGTGKSVALRRLASRLLCEAYRTETLAIYLNLREWPCPAAWTADRLPTAQEVTDSLWEWAKSQMRDRIDGATGGFTSEYAEELSRAGRLFFLLDSFDETRALLDLPKENALVERIAEGARRLLRGDNEARGIIASRYDRSPARWLQADRWFELRPLENKRIEQLVRQHFNDDKAVWRWLKRQRELTMLPRNPFEVFLIAEHLEREPRDPDNRPVFPRNRAEAYASCLRRRLRGTREWLNRHSIGASAPLPSLESLEQRLVDLAEALYTGPRGLEVALRDLPETLRERLPSPVVDAFVEARVLRAGEGEDRTLSFIHSRFGEALAARFLMANPDWVSFEDIPTVGRWRDVLIVYFEIADLDDVKRLAAGCYAEIQNLGATDVPATHPNWIRAVRCLRFLDEACRYRREASEEISQGLAEKLEEALSSEVDPLTSKLLIEGLSLARPDRISALLGTALDHPHPVVQETAFWACRYLTAAEGSFVRQFRRRLLQTPPLLLLHPRWAILARLRSIASLRPIARLYVAQVVDIIAWLGGAIALGRLPVGPFPMFIALVVWTDDATHAFRMWKEPAKQEKLRMEVELLRWAAGVVTIVASVGGWIGKDGLWVAILLMPIAPWIFDSQRRGSELRESNIIDWKKTLEKVGGVAGMVLVIFLLGLAGEGLNAVGWGVVRKWFERIFGYLALTVMALLVLGIFYVAGAGLVQFLSRAWKSTRRWLKDRRFYRETSLQSGSLDRVRIQRIWDRLTTPYWRNKLVDELYLIREVTGEWSGQPPYTGTDRASRRLMKLDERWLGLER